MPNFADHGAQLLPDLVGAELTNWRQAAEKHFDERRPGKRILGDRNLAKMVSKLLGATSLRETIDNGWSCVRMIAFDKSPTTNWSLGWHQDRTIAVRERKEIDGFGPWSTKDGIPHVEPPFELLERMVTLRLHLDQVTSENGALIIAPRSHARGKISENQIETIVAELSSYTCHAKAGDVWLYKTPILHASGRSSTRARRRVLHLDLSKDALPKPLEWRGIL